MIGKVNHQISELIWIGTIPLSLTQPITKINSSIEVWTKIQTLDFPGNKPICYPLSYPVLDAIIMSCLNGCFCTNEIDNKFISNQQKSFWCIYRLEPGLFFFSCDSGTSFKVQDAEGGTISVKYSEMGCKTYVKENVDTVGEAMTN